MMWKTWRVIADQFKSKHGKKKLAQLGATSDAKLKEALADESSASAAWKLAYFEKMGKNAPEWLQKRSPEDISIVLGFLFVLLTFFQKWGAEEMRKNTMAMDVDYNHPLESGLASESPADFLQEPRRRCYGLYLKNKYYRKDGGGALQPYFDSGTVFRTIANIIIGMLTLNPLINFKTNDPVSVFLKGAEVLGYWEVLTRLIGLYGLAPVYITTHWLLQSLTPPPKKKKGVVAQALSYIKKA